MNRRTRLGAIESLKLEHGHVDWMEIVHKLPLNQLELRQCNGIGDNILKKMVRVGSPWPATMVELHFINCPCVSHNGLAALASLTNLTKLSLVSMDLNNPVLQSFASLSKLQALDLTSCQKISAQGLTGIANMLQLKELNLSNCSRIQGADALLALKKLENLEKLWLRELQLDDKSLVPLRMVNSLKYIDLWGVRQATDQGLVTTLLTRLSGDETHFFLPTDQLLVTHEEIGILGSHSNQSWAQICGDATPPSTKLACPAYHTRYTFACL